MQKAVIHRKVRLRVAAVAAQQGLSDLELAHKAQVQATVVRRMLASHWEHITLSQLIRVAEALGVPTCTLIDEQSNENAQI